MFHYEFLKFYFLYIKFYQIFFLKKQMKIQIFLFCYFITLKSFKIALNNCNINIDESLSVDSLFRNISSVKENCELFITIDENINMINSSKLLINQLNFIILYLYISVIFIIFIIFNKRGFQIISSKFYGKLFFIY